MPEPERQSVPNVAYCFLDLSSWWTTFAGQIPGVYRPRETRTANPSAQVLRDSRKSLTQTDI